MIKIGARKYFFPGFEIKYSSRKSDMFSDFQIMHNSKFLVISNSTFSFWAGFWEIMILLSCLLYGIRINHLNLFQRLDFFKC